MSAIAIIPARGGSKRIPRKNIRNFMGKPIIAYSIETALQSGLFERVVVSSDDDEICEVAKHYGAEVPFKRPRELADDHAIAFEAVTHALQWFESKGQRFEFACCIYATAPFMRKDKLKDGLTKIRSGPFNYVFSATRFDYPIQRGFKLHADDTVEALEPQFVQTRSQDLPTVYHDAAQFYWGKVEAFKARVNLLDMSSAVVVLPSSGVQDIDNLDDWGRAEQIFRSQKVTRATALSAAKLTINGRFIGNDYKPFLVAELSGNHNGSLARALDLVTAAHLAGADAIKIQTYTADTLTIDYSGPDFKINEGPWKGRTLYDLYQEASTPWEWHKEIFDKGNELGLLVFSSPFDERSVDFLEGLSCPAYKIASFEIVDLGLIRKAAGTGKPLIISTGIANLNEIEEAVTAARESGCEQLMLLHCVSSYPAPDEDSNLMTIPDLMERFNVPVGLSDHTHGVAVSVASVGLGGCMIEKHMTLAREDGGPDAAFSLEPDEFTELVKQCQTAYSARGKVDYGIKASEQKSRIFRRSLYIVQDVKAGEVLTREHVRSIRPGYGLAPKYLDNIVGRIALKSMKRGEPVAWDLITFNDVSRANDT